MATSLLTATDPKVGDGPPQAVQSRSEFLPGGYRAAVRQIEDLKSLPAGWDSYGAKAIEPIARENAIAFLTMVATHIDKPLPEVVVGPSANGGVVLRWEPGSLEVVVTLLSRGGDYYVAERDGDRVIEDGDVGSLEACVKLISQYLVR